MKKWNGWGNENSDFDMELGESLRAVLDGLLGAATPLESLDFETACKLVPESRLSAHPLIDTSIETRLRHTRGQSLPDWLAMRSGDIDAFPDAVAFPETSAHVQELLQLALTEDITLIPYGGGTSVVGHINPVKDDRPILTISMAKMNTLISLDKESQVATFGAGTPGPLIESQLKEYGFTLGHFPQSWELSTVGGWVASRSSGQQSLHYGRIEQIFAGGKIETLKGTLDIPTIPASSAGPDLREIVLGSEGRFGIISEVKVRVSPIAENEFFQVIFLPSWETGIKAARALAQQKVPLSMVRLSNAMETYSLMRMKGDDSSAVDALDTALLAHGIGEGKVMMTYGVTGSNEQCDFSHQMALKVCAQHGGVPDGVNLGDNWADGRFKAPYLRDPLGEAGYAVDTMETAVDWSNVVGATQEIEAAIAGALQDEGEHIHVYTHLSHVYGQGSSIYTTYLFRFGNSYAQTYQRWQKIKHAGAQATVDCGGTISHQHGVGADHRNYLEAEKGALGIDTLHSLCDFFDPDSRMNPGKLLPDAK